MNTRKIKSLSFLFFFLLFTATSLKSQNASYSFEFLNLPTTPQTVANGGISLTFITGNAGNSFDNPALFGEETAGNLFLSYMNYLSGANAFNSLYGRPINDRACWAVGIRGINYGKLQGYTKDNIPTHTFSATNIALEALFSYDLTNKLRGGIALKTLYGNIEKYNSFALAVDLGLSYYNGEKGLSLGAAITNAGVMLKGFQDKKFNPIWDIRFGYSQRFLHAPFRIHTSIYGLNPIYFQNQRNDQKTIHKILRHISMGVEYLFQESFWLGIGYNPRIAQDLKLKNGNLLSGLSIGTGFNHKYFTVALSASSYHPSNLSLMLSISTNFGNDQFIF